MWFRRFMMIAVMCTFIGRMPPPGRVSFLSGFHMYSLEEEDPPRKITSIFSKIGVVFHRGSPSSKLCIWKPTKKDPPPGGWVSFDQCV